MTSGRDNHSIERHAIRASLVLVLACGPGRSASTTTPAPSPPHATGTSSPSGPGVPAEEELRLQFRLTATASFESLEPSRIEPRLLGLAHVRRFRIYDDRLSDASFVTVVVAVDDSTRDGLESLRRALLRIPGTRAFAVDPSGRTYSLDTLEPERIATLARTDASAGP